MQKQPKIGWLVFLMRVPYRSLPEVTLRNMIEEFVTRDGTDYGVLEAPLKTKIAQVMAALEAGKAEVQFDESLQIAEIVLTEAPS